MSELNDLKKQADDLGIKYNPNISAVTLKQRIQDYSNPVEAPAVNPTERIKLEATKLIRCQITPMDRSKSNYQGEIFATGNSLIPTIKRYVPFGATTHVEQMLLDVIDSKEMVMFYTEQVNGREVRKAKSVKAYGVQILPQLTEKELSDLAKAQQARNSIE
jgi:hypothetical protein